MLTNCLAACAHLTITVSEIERDIYEKNRHFINSMLAKPLAACAYLSSIVSELYDAEVNA